MEKKTVGLIGLGAMGAPMAERLVDSGFRVLSCANRNRTAIDRLKEKGLSELNNPLDIGAEADILMTVVWDEEQNDRILRGPEGAFNSLKKGSAVLVMSTVSPQYCKDLAAEASVKCISVVDCPLSGMPVGAKAGTLNLFFGGKEETIEYCREVLDVLGTIIHCGDVGAGQVMKLGNNAMFIGTFLILLEVLDMVRATGMDGDRFIDILNKSTGRSFVSQNIPMPKKHIKLEGMPEKDLSFCLGVAEQNDVKMPILQMGYDTGTKS